VSSGTISALPLYVLRKTAHNTPTAMPPFRMPFGRKTQTVNGIAVGDENRPHSYEGQLSPKHAVSVSETRRPSAISIKSKRDEPEDFELGVVNDSGVFVPPSPPEKKSMWKRTPTATTTSSRRSVVSDNDGFSISRESFDSYRRSFDISARSPVIHPESSYSRQSLDSLRTPNTPRSIRQHSNRSFELPRPPKTVEEEREEAAENGNAADVFEDVGLEDGTHKQPAARKGLFSRFIKDDGSNSSSQSARPASSHGNGRFHLPGRKRGQSGQGSELGEFPKQGLQLPPAVVVDSKEMETVAAK